MTLTNWIKNKAAWCKQQIFILYLAYRDPRTPGYAKLFTALIIAYALSPIDLIPDFIPVLGYLDDAIILPLGVILAIRLIPRPVWADSRILAQKRLDQRLQKSQSGVYIVIAIWLAILMVAGVFVFTIL